MSETFSLSLTVSYGDVDRDESLLLSGVCKCLQEAAIKHANLFDTGTHAMAARGESWMLHRMALRVSVYPRYEDNLRVETWSRGVNGFRGYREYRVYRGPELIISASSLWLYLNLKTKTLLKVPPDIVESFPFHQADIFQPELDRLKLPEPDRAFAQGFPVTVRYSDFDGNAHVNNAVYFDYLQTALARAGLPTRPRELQIKFAKEISAATSAIDVRVEAREPVVLFSMSAGENVFAHGQVT